MFFPNIFTCSVAVIGLGYVGLPLALEFAKKGKCNLSGKNLSRTIIGFDLNSKRIKELKKGIDHTNETNRFDLENTDVIFTDEESKLKLADIFIVTVPTPINKNKEPDLTLLKEASNLIGKSIKNSNKRSTNQIVIFESTVYPGVTEEICVPIIENISGMKFNSPENKNSFYCGYSPERINPGDDKYSINSIIKVTSGCNKKVSNWIDKFYGSFINAGTFNVSSIKIAEAAKIIENTQRDINIALINELAILFKKMGINTQEVLEAADSKWNFQKYLPGLVGGHCIGVDPYYLAFKAKEIGYETKLISAGRSINDYMHQYLFQQILLHTKNRNNNIKTEEVLLLGLSYKSNTGDVRNSQLVDLVKNIKNREMKITIVDPQVNKEEVHKKTGLVALSTIPKNKKYTLIVFALKHKEFNKITKASLSRISDSNTIIFDLTNTFSGQGIINF